MSNNKEYYVYFDAEIWFDVNFAGVVLELTDVQFDVEWVVLAEDEQDAIETAQAEYEENLQQGLFQITNGVEFNPRDYYINYENFKDSLKIEFKNIETNNLHAMEKYMKGGE